MAELLRTRSATVQPLVENPKSAEIISPPLPINAHPPFSSTQFDTVPRQGYIGMESNWDTGLPMAAMKTIDRVAIITMQGDSADALTRALTGAGFQVTLVESRGGFLLEPSSTLLIGYSSPDQEILLQHVRSLCCTRKRLVPVQPDGSLLPALPLMIEAEVGGASVIAMRVERFLQL
jgi:uncharacterized protein YaaQ